MKVGIVGEGDVAGVDVCLVPHAERIKPIAKVIK
jgi:hypothetical protein